MLVNLVHPIQMGIILPTLTEDHTKAVLQAGGVRFETDSDKNYTIHIRYFQQSYVNPKWYSDTDLTIWVPKGFLLMMQLIRLVKS